MRGSAATKGFTLIELLVVIAIIGLLASVVLASLADARAKGRYAQVISQMRQIAQAAEIANNGTYAGDEDHDVFPPEFSTILPNWPKPPAAVGLMTGKTGTTVGRYISLCVVRTLLALLTIVCMIRPLTARQTPMGPIFRPIGRLVRSRVMNDNLLSAGWRLYSGFRSPRNEFPAL